jgi:mannose-1-phosphate guanylyltransferase/phosphomannomutase
LKAVLMAGGEGTRLRPLTSNQPKPMVNIFNKPVMEYIIELLKSHDIKDIIVTLQFLPQLIKNYYGDGNDLGVNLSYAIEDEPLGTAGSVKNAEDFLKERFIVISGDALTDFDLKKAVAFHKKKKSFATLVLTRVKNPLEFGVVITNEKGKIKRFLEKPNWGQVFSDTVNTGIYVLEPEVLSHIPKGKSVDFSKDLFPKLLAEGYPLYGYIADGYWCDIGSLEQYSEVHSDILNNKVNIKIDGIKMMNNIWVGNDTVIDPDVNFEGPAFIGQHSKIETGAKIGPGTVIGNNVMVKSNVKMYKTIIQENTYIGNASDLDQCLIGKNCDIKQGSKIMQGVVIGDDCLVGENALIGHNVKVYPFKSIDAGATVNRSIIWESKGMRTLFGVEGISGIANVDITPELVVRVAMALGTSLPKESFVVTSRDSNRVSRMVKRAMIAGLTATGVHVRDLRVAPTPVNRFNVATSRCAGGIHIGVSPFDPQTIQILFFDKEGINLGESGRRDIEKYFSREDYRRAFHNEFGEIIFPPRTGEYYANGLVSHIDLPKIRESKFKVIIDYAYGSASFTMPQILGKLGIEAVTLNAFTDESNTTISHLDLERCVKRLSETVKIFKADFGVLIDNACEKMIVIDNKGQQISYNDLLHLMVYLVSKYEPLKGNIAVPLSVSNIADDIAEEYGRKVIRTRISAADLMQSSFSEDVIFAGGQGARFIFPDFLPAYDAAMSLCKLMEYLAHAKQPLSKIVSSWPKANILETQTTCSWENKGMVMRSIIEGGNNEKMELIDGVKIYDAEGWTLILPHPEEPVIRIIAEDVNKKEVRARLNKAVNKVNEIIENDK